MTLFKEFIYRVQEMKTNFFLLYILSSGLNFCLQGKSTDSFPDQWLLIEPMSQIETMKCYELMIYEFNGQSLLDVQ